MKGKISCFHGGVWERDKLSPLWPLCCSLPDSGLCFWQSKHDTEGDAVHHRGPLPCAWAAHSVPTASVRGKWMEMGSTEKQDRWLSAAFDIGGRMGQ